MVWSWITHTHTLEIGFGSVLVYLSHSLFFLLPTDHFVYIQTFFLHCYCYACEFKLWVLVTEWEISDENGFFPSSITSFRLIQTEFPSLCLRLIHFIVSNWIESNRKCQETFVASICVCVCVWLRWDTLAYQRKLIILLLFVSSVSIRIKSIIFLNWRCLTTAFQPDYIHPKWDWQPLKMHGYFGNSN